MKNIKLIVAVCDVHLVLQTTFTVSLKSKKIKIKWKRSVGMQLLSLKVCQKKLFRNESRNLNFLVRFKIINLGGGC